MSVELLISYIWKPSINLKKEVPRGWERCEIHVHKRRGEEEKPSYLQSREYNNEDGLPKKFIYYYKNGEIESVTRTRYLDELTVVTESMEKDVVQSQYFQHFNQHGLLEKELSVYSEGETDETKYFYDEKNRLTKIIQKEDGEMKWEDLIYQDGRLFKVETHKEDGGSLFRGFIYDDQGRLEKMIRMQGARVNKEAKYFYNEKNQLVREMLESVNRVAGGKNSLWLTEYEYHPNGQMKMESFQTMDSYKGITKTAWITNYNEQGWTTEFIDRNYRKDSEEINAYHYK